MKPLEDYELNEVSGSAPQQELLEFLERLLREMPPSYIEPFLVAY